MPRRLEWSLHSRKDVERIEEFYSLAASPEIAQMARDAIVNAAIRLVTLPVLHRPGKGDTREYVMKRFPYTIIYKATSGSVRIVRVLHQARKYFRNRGLTPIILLQRLRGDLRDTAAVCRDD